MDIVERLPQAERELGFALIIRSTDPRPAHILEAELRNKLELAYPSFKLVLVKVGDQNIHQPY